MLVLTRRVNESILIGDDIEVVVLAGRNGASIRIGVRAPDDVAIVRRELLERCKKKSGDPRSHGKTSKCS